MAQFLSVKESGTKVEKYEDILPQIKGLVSEETNLIANLANVAAILWQGFGHLWTGFYLREGDDLVLGPFQGPIACTRIPVKPVARGVCGRAAQMCQTVIVDDVEKFEGHIACSPESKSEIVVPLALNGHTALVLDIDSRTLNSFDDIDAKYLQRIIDILENQHFRDKKTS